MATPVQGQNQIAQASTIQPLIPSLGSLAANISTTGASVCNVTNQGGLCPGFPASGTFDIQIDSEDIQVTGQSYNFPNLTWTLLRGQNSTSASTHTVGTTIRLYAGSWANQLPVNTQLSDGIAIKALAGNSVGNYVYVGVSGASGWDQNRSYPLAPGEGIALDSSQAASVGSVYIYGPTVGDGVAYLGA